MVWTKGNPSFTEGVPGLVLKLKAFSGGPERKGAERDKYPQALV